VSGYQIFDGGLVQASVLIRAAQQLVLVGNPVDVLPAPGAGKAIVILSAACSLHFNTTAYGNTGLGNDNPADPEASLNYFGPNLYPAFQLNSFYTLLIATQNTLMTWCAPQQYVIPRSECENRPVVFCNPSATGTNFINGDSDLALSILYRVIDL
jgi:hypothetical protein